MFALSPLAAGCSLALNFDDPPAPPDATPIDAPSLVRNLQATLNINPEPELQFQPEADASYDLSAKVLNIIKGSKVTKFGFVGNEQYSEFDKSATAPAQ